MTSKSQKKKYKQESKNLKNHIEYKIPKIRLTLVRETAVDFEPARIYGPEEFEELVEPLKNASEEYFISIHLDSKSNAIGFHEISHGTLSSSLVHPREVFKASILNNAHSIIVAHNHPSGSLEPSENDIDTTENLVKAGEILGVKVVDHIIVSFKGINSLRMSHSRLFPDW